MNIETYAHVNLEIKPVTATTYELALTFDIDPYDGIYEQYLRISIDNPAIIVSKFNCSAEPTSQYVAAFKENKSVFIGPCTFTCTLTSPSAQEIYEADLYITYQLLCEKHSKTIVLPLRNFLPPPSAPADIQAHIDIPHTSSAIFSSIPKTEINTAPTNNDITVIVDTAYPWIIFILSIAALALITILLWRLPLFYSTLLIASGALSYYGAHHMPVALYLKILTFICALIGFILLYQATYARKFPLRTLAASLGMALIACSILLTAKAYQAHYTEPKLSLEKSLSFLE